MHTNYIGCLRIANDIQLLTGKGYEILVDKIDPDKVLIKFQDGRILSNDGNKLKGNEEATIVA